MPDQPQPTPHAEKCRCRCDTCLDSDCEGHICRKHEPGRWVIVSPFMEHPLPTDFASKDEAEQFLAPFSGSRLSVQLIEGCR